MWEYLTADSEHFCSQDLYIFVVFWDRIILIQQPFKWKSHVMVDYAKTSLMWPFYVKVKFSTAKHTYRGLFELGRRESIHN